MILLIKNLIGEKYMQARRAARELALILFSQFSVIQHYIHGFTPCVSVSIGNNTQILFCFHVKIDCFLLTSASLPCIL